MAAHSYSTKWRIGTTAWMFGLALNDCIWFHRASKTSKEYHILSFTVNLPAPPSGLDGPPNASGSFVSINLLRLKLTVGWMSLPRK
jgi:hypothetical protein